MSVPAGVQAYVICVENNRYYDFRGDSVVSLVSSLRIALGIYFPLEMQNSRGDIQHDPLHCLTDWHG
jgi:hypothetical protein